MMASVIAQRGALVSRICNQPGLVRVTHEAALKKDYWMLHTNGR